MNLLDSFCYGEEEERSTEAVFIIDVWSEGGERTAGQTANADDHGLSFFRLESWSIESEINAGGTARQFARQNRKAFFLARSILVAGVILHS